MYFEGKCKMYESKGDKVQLCSGFGIVIEMYTTKGGVCCFNMKKPNIPNLKKHLKTVMYRKGLTVSNEF